MGLLASLYSLRMLGLFMILPIFSIYANQLKYVTPWRIGLAIGIYGLTQAIFQIPFGYLSDRFGRKPLIIIGLLVFAFGSVVAALSDTIMGVIVGRALQGMGAIGSVIMALLSDLTRDEMRLRAMAVIGITIGLSFGVAFVLGPLVSGWYGLQGIFWITAWLSLLAVGMVIGWIPEGERKSNLEQLPFLKSVSLHIRQVLNRAFHFRNFNGGGILNPSSYSLINLYAGVLILHASLTALFLKIPYALDTFGFDADHSWKFYVPIFLASLVTTIPVIFWMEKTKVMLPKLAVVVVCLIVSECGILFGFNSVHVFVLSLWLFFMAFNVLEASLPSLISKKANENSRGTALGLFSALQFLGLFLGGVIGGALDSWGGLVTVLGFCIILALSWLVWMFKLMSYKEV